MPDPLRLVRFDVRQVASFLMEILVNFVLPYAIYVYAKQSLGDAHALMASSFPPIAWSVLEFARKRTVDAISLIVIVGIALSLLAFIGGGSVRFLQLRESLVGGLVALVFLGSAAIGRPLVYQLALAMRRRKSQAQADAFAQLRVRGGFRRGMMVMTLVWGFGLLASTIVSVVLVFSMPIRDYLLVSPFISYGAVAALGFWSFWYARQMKRAGTGRQGG